MLMVMYLKALIKDLSKGTGDKFLCLMVLNSLMRSNHQGLLQALEVKLLRRLYIILSPQNRQRGIGEYSSTDFYDKQAAKMFYQLLK